MKKVIKIVLIVFGVLLIIGGFSSADLGAVVLGGLMAFIGIKMKTTRKIKSKPWEPERSKAVAPSPAKKNLENYEGDIVFSRYLMKARIKDYVAFDTETTGVDPQESRIIEIAGVKVRNEEVVDTFSTLVDPGVKIPKEASAVNHITDKMVHGQPNTAEALKMFFDFCGDDVLIGHNAEHFDMPLLCKEARRCKLPEPKNKVADTLWISRIYFKGLENYKLGTVCSHIHYKQKKAHRALDDSLAVHAVVKEARNVYRENRDM